MMRLSHILVPTDFSDGAEAAFAAALALAQQNGARLTLLHVHHVPVVILPEAVLPASPQLLGELERASEHALAELAARAEAAGVRASWRVALGATHRQICEVAGELDVDLVVIGSHGRGGLAGALLGSVAERVVRRAPCPVLTVRAGAPTVAHA